MARKITTVEITWRTSDREKRAVFIYCNPRNCESAAPPKDEGCSDSCESIYDAFSRKMCNLARPNQRQGFTSEENSKNVHGVSDLHPRGGNPPLFGLPSRRDTRGIHQATVVFRDNCRAIIT
ncbi:hypothetical protein DMN91_010953 [Ooceraea biroi]|uniref:Uncharacterized protein n=1 Tax=Ooceraea biroi TaxID=2015173 RepID=A0A3L8D977_OOCBI|nr:hypothetical protein DMN91_010953 [Ooceraea biroi]